jgi:hypothetical protein
MGDSVSVGYHILLPSQFKCIWSIQKNSQIKRTIALGAHPPTRSEAAGPYLSTCESVTHLPSSA